jgi:1-phosphatidylinositol-3-phosphate 5-kinase
MAESLLASDPMDLDRLSQTLEDIAFVVAGHLLFSMNFRSSNGFNYSSLVKVKSIAAADTVQKNVREKNYHFKWLAGTVFRKHVSHKQMARQIANPRILLFACGISYDRSSGSGKLSSLDTLLEQEKSYMSILVDKICALEPDVIFVEKTVSRHAQELLRERHVVIVLNVKPELLERIARHTGATLLTSVDHVDKVDRSQVIGTCRSFQVKTIPTVPDEDPLPASARPGPKKFFGMVKPLKGTPPKDNIRLRTETYLYLDGCDPLNGCTVLITGLSKQKLRLLKRLTRGVLSMTYRLLLEAHVLSDLNLNQRVLTSRESIEPIGKKNTTWCTTCTLRVRDSAGPSSSPRYHQCVEPKHLGIMTYSDNDISFGNFLTQEMAALSLKCQVHSC